MRDILEFVPFVIWMLFIIGIAKTAKKQKGKTNNRNVQFNNQTTVKKKASKPINKGTSMAQEKASVPSTKFASNSVLFEDRKNDWLAKQIREEARIRRRDGLDLGAGHQDNCDARNLKLEHRTQHNKL